MCELCQLSVQLVAVPVQGREGLVGGGGAEGGAERGAARLGEQRHVRQGSSTETGCGAGLQSREIHIGVI